MNQDRIHDIYRPVPQRIADFEEVERHFSGAEIRSQAERCMHCGIPFCHGSGCPLGNVIPEFNEAVAKGNDNLAYAILSETSFFPEFTSRVCPALCEGSCTHGIDEEPVMIRQCEKYIIETAFANHLVKPIIPEKRNGMKIAVVGSGPSGLYMAEALNRKGFHVTVFEKNHAPGGLLRYGIPDFKLNKKIIDRRIRIMEAEGIHFETDTEIGKDISADYLHSRFDAVVLAIGTPAARDLKIPGRELQGIHFALEFLQGQNRVNAGELSELPVNAKNKRVLVIGGGDTGSDCVGTAIRQGAESVLQIEIMPQPPEKRSPSTPWPMWPYMLRTSSSQKEGCGRRWNVISKEFLGRDGKVCALKAASAKWEFSKDGKPLKFTEIPDSEEIIEADLVLLAMGFTGVPKEGLVSQLGLEQTSRNTLLADPARKIFTTGDCTNGASLVVRAMADAKKAADILEAQLEINPSSSILHNL